MSQPEDRRQSCPRRRRPQWSPTACIPPSPQAPPVHLLRRWQAATEPAESQKAPRPHRPARHHQGDDLGRTSRATGSPSTRRSRAGSTGPSDGSRARRRASTAADLLALAEACRLASLWSSRTRSRTETTTSRSDEHPGEVLSKVLRRRDTTSPQFASRIHAGGSLDPPRASRAPDVLPTKARLVELRPQPAPPGRASAARPGRRGVRGAGGLTGRPWTRRSRGRGTRPGCNA